METEQIDKSKVAVSRTVFMSFQQKHFTQIFGCVSQFMTESENSKVLEVFSPTLSKL